MKKKPKSALPLFAETQKRRLVRVGDETVDPQRLTLAQHVKLVYGRERSLWESLQQGKPVRYWFPKAYEAQAELRIESDDGPLVQKARPSTWVKIADWLLYNDLQRDVDSYIAWQFEESTHEVGARPPEPQQLTAETRKQDYLASKDKISEKVRVSLEVQKKTAERHFWYYKSNAMDAVSAWVCVLADGSLELSPLFRFCVSSQLDQPQMDKIAERFCADAILQFQRYRRWYKKHWRAVLPEGFLKLSRQLYPYLLAREVGA